MITRRKRWLGTAATGTLVLALCASLAPANALAPAHTSGAHDPGGHAGEGTTVLLPGAALLDTLSEQGFDVDHGAERVPDGIEIEVHADEAELAELEELGAEILEPGEEFSWDAIAAAEPTTRHTTAADKGVQVLSGSALTEVRDQVRVVRADWFTTKGQGFLYVEARTELGAQTTPVIGMTLENDGGAGSEFGFARTMSRFVDSGEYMTHRNLFKLDERPEQIRVTDSTGATTTGVVSDWLENAPAPLTENPGYLYDFIDGYKTPQQLDARAYEIAAQYPDIAEIIELPYETNGYQRKAQAILGSGASRVVVHSAAWGHEGGNDVTVELGLAAGANQPLTVTSSGSAVTVSLATDEAGAATSTVADVVEALETQAADLIGRAHAYRTNDPLALAVPTAGPVALTDGLDNVLSTAPEGVVPRGPATIEVLRIGKHRDGSKPGVLIQAQDHAREWVPATASLEAAERLVQNYATDKDTREIVNNTDVFFILSNNPDGANYSFYNFNMQRKNLTNHCEDALADPGYANSWGVDLNRNYRVGSAHDGYSGGSFTCTSGTYQGPEKLSEPEAKNITWLAENYSNIKFMMSVHSNGGQLFWQPGAYIADGRITTPRPPMGDEAFYWQAASRILGQVKNHRETVVTPQNVGGSSDVLYSSAGNVREDLYHTYGIYAFGWEVGGSVYNPATGGFQSGSFQPPWEGELLSGHDETLEYANGLMEMFRVAADWGRDRKKPTSKIVTEEVGSGVEVSFTTSEPATIYYTIDGTAPTLASSRYEATEFREGGQVFLVTEKTTFQWFSVDAAGNVEKGYDPDKNGKNYNSATVAP